MAADSSTYTEDTIQRRRRMAEALMANSLQPQKIEHWTQGLAQMARAATGGYIMRQANEEQRTNDRAVTDAVKSIYNDIAGGDTSSPGIPSAPGAPPINAKPMGEVTIPEQYRPIIAQAAKQYGLPEDLLARQLHQESGFNPTVVSSAGAQGIAQFMPGTAKDMGVNAFDPSSAIPGAAKYLAQNRDRYGGDMNKALAAYNWGPGNVDKWAAAGADPSKLPAETQNYLNRIVGPQAFAPTGQPSAAMAALPPQITGAAMAGGADPQPHSQEPTDNVRLRTARALAAPVPGNAPGPLPAPSGVRPEQSNVRSAIANMLNSENPAVQRMGQKLASGYIEQQMKPRDYGFQTLPDGTVLRTDPRTGTIAPIYQSKGNFGFQTTPDGTIIRTDPRTGEIQPAYKADLKPTWGVIGEDDFGNKNYGWIDPNNRTTTPGGAASGGALTAPGAGGSGAPVAGGATALPPRTLIGPDGKLIEIPVGQDPKKFREHVTTATADARVGKMTEVQAAATAYGNRMEQAEENIQKHASGAHGLAGFAGGVADGISDGAWNPIPKGATNWAVPQQYEQLKQAKSQWITALLRKESGAAIAPSEFDRYDREFFPQLGDSAAVVKQKAAARQTALDAQIKAAGPAYTPVKKSAPAAGDKPDDPLGIR